MSAPESRASARGESFATKSGRRRSAGRTLNEIAGNRPGILAVRAIFRGADEPAATAIRRPRAPCSSCDGEPFAHGVTVLLDPNEVHASGQALRVIQPQVLAAFA